MFAFSQSLCYKFCMKRLILLAAICLMVSGATLGAAHDIAHAQGEHTELCGAYKFDNQSAVVSSAPISGHHSCTVSFTPRLHGEPFVGFTGMMWFGRAPPQ